MPNLQSLLSTSIDDAARPPALPDGTYYGLVKSFDTIESNKINKDTGQKTPGVQFMINLTHAHEDVDLSEYLSQKGAKPLAERQFRHTFWITEGSLWRFADFLKSLGLPTEGQSFGALLPSSINQPVVLDITRSPTEDGKGYFNDVKSVTGVPAEAPAEGRRRRAG